MRISLPQAIEALTSGKVIAVPTETVYGLAASLHHENAIEQIFTLKKRPHSNPLIIHIANFKDLEKYATHYPPMFEKLAHTFWPGPLTCILPVGSNVPSLVRAGLPTAGFRIPSHPITHQLLKATGPLVMPSANLSGKPSATKADHVEQDFGVDFPILDGGNCLKGVESTILFYQEPEWVILRLGALQPEMFHSVLGYQPRFKHMLDGGQPLSPGQLFRHYSPKARLFFGNHEALLIAPFILGFRERSYPAEKRIIYLGSLSHPEEVAANLYQALRQLDQEGAEQAWIDSDFPRHGLWQTIAERLLRAANHY